MRAVATYRTRCMRITHPRDGDSPGLADYGGMPQIIRLRSIFAVAAICLVATAANASTSSTGTTYYVSPSGSDSAAGSLIAPWKTVARVNRATLNPGDTVLFQGDSTFTDQTLMPASSGAFDTPVTFGSYGSGTAKIANPNGAVWIVAGEHDLAFDGLDLSSTGSIVFAAAGSGSGTSGITLRNSTIHDSPYAAVVVQSQDRNWTISGNVFRHTGDSGIIVQGAGVTIDRNTITDTGWNTALNYGKHGIYAKGPAMTISNNDISFNANGSAISLRYAGARVFSNLIHDTNYAVSFFPQDPSNTGVNRIFYNRMWNITGFAFYYAGTNDNGQPAAIDVVWASNTALLANASDAVNVSELSAAHVEITNSVFGGSYGSAYRGCTTCSENHNDWYGGISNVPYGPADKHVAPDLSASPSLTPSASSPVVDGGTTLVSNLTYSASCDGEIMHYCLSSPDLGAVESVYSPSPAPADTTPPSAPLNLAFGGVTQTSVTLTWTASTDDRAVVNYTVSHDGSTISSAVASATVEGLACGTTTTFVVVAYDAAGNHSPDASTSGSTAACDTTVTPPPLPPSGNGHDHPHKHKGTVA